MTPAVVFRPPGRRRCSSLRCVAIVAVIAFAIVLLYLSLGLDTIVPKRIRGKLFSPSTPDHRLCVLVPYRDRIDELRVFVAHMHRFLTAQAIDYRIIVLNQTDSYRFNRASLINVGWFEARLRQCDYIVMHDVDLLPVNPELNYRYNANGPRHIASPEYHPKYNYTKFIGGILMLTVEDYERANGMSNKYWGWGLEDDEFYLRLRDANLLSRLERPTNLTTDRSNTFRHLHNSRKRRRDYAKTGMQRSMSRKRDRVSGLNTLRYRITGIRYQAFATEVPPAIVLDIELHCDRDWTPYCVQLPPPDSSAL